VLDGDLLILINSFAKRGNWMLCGLTKFIVRPDDKMMNFVNFYLLLLCSNIDEIRRISH
jgi:hypothetical protein